MFNKNYYFLEFKEKYIFCIKKSKKIHQTSPRDSPDDFKKSKKKIKKIIIFENFYMKVFCL